MNSVDEPNTGDALERALDRALERHLVAPALPAGFRQQLQAAIIRSAQRDPAVLAAALEREHAAQLAQLQSDYVRLRQRTLGTLIGAAFAAGLLINFALPWISTHFGSNGVVALPAIGVAVGLALSARVWWRRSSLARLLP
ncbi:MAG TPA: hypothetical protein VK505_02270 [Steroidobacteraceae bacterium]|jgi:hypothetical protein|nr:hypothetical protein [Steroidobacteraceae bacterium]